MHLQTLLAENLNMDEKKSLLIKKAQKLYGEIFPCVNKPSLEECFTFSLDGEPILWFNTQDKSTHMVTSDKIAVYDVLKGDKTRRKRKIVS